MNFPNREELAWLAALFEGEGSVKSPISKNKKGGFSSALGIRINMCDLDVLERFKSFARGGIISGPYAPRGIGKKEFFSYAIRGKAAYALLVAFWPWLGVRRKQQVYGAVLKWGTMKETRHGVKLTSDQVKDIRLRIERGKHGISKKLAKEYNVSIQTISHIKTGETWA